MIVDYADTLNDVPVLIPRDDAAARLRVKRWEALSDGIMDSAIVVRNERLRAEDKQSRETLALHATAITHALAYAALLLGEGEWCEGKTLTLADLALISALIYLDLRLPERDWRGTHANLATWFDRISMRPSVIESNKS